MTFATACRLLAWLSVLLLASLRADPEPERFTPYKNAPRFLAAVEHDMEIVYKEVHGVELRLDLYRPLHDSGNGPLPVLLNFHGGGFREGSKFGFAANTFLAETFLPLMQSGRLAVVSVNYRFLDAQTTLEDVVADAFDALRWIRQHAADYRLDPEQVTTMGHSAGAYLALMLSLAPAESFPGHHPNAPARVVRALALAPPIRPGAAATQPPSPIEAPLLNLLHHVHDQMPPTLVVCGTEDRLMADASSFVTVTLEAGGSARLLAVQHAGHRLYQPQPGWEPSRTELQFELRNFVGGMPTSPSPRRIE